MNEKLAAVEEMLAGLDTREEWMEAVAKMKTRDQVARGYQDGARKAAAGITEWTGPDNDYGVGVRAGLKRYTEFGGN